MYKIIILLFVYSISIHANVIGPSWFIQNSNEHIIYSYAKDLNQAKIKAKNKLEEKLDINININDFSILKSQEFENKYFIKVKYINESLFDQINSELKSLAFKAKTINNKYLISTPFLKQIKEYFGYYPDIQINDNYLHFNNKKFLIKHNEFYDFYATLQDENLSLDIKDIINENEKFFIEVANINKNKYTTLARVIKNKVEILFKNENINNMIFPNFKVSDGLEISLENINSLEFLTIAISCDEKKDFTNYNMIFENKKNSLTFSDFINEINNCDISSNISKVIK